MQSFVIVHPGEFLVGDHVTRYLGKKYDVWVPAKDTGVDLLLTPKGKSKRAIKLQVKFSRSYDRAAANYDEFVVRGWYTLDRKKIGKSTADYWVFVIADFRRKMQFLVVPIAELKGRNRGRGRTWHLYLTICGKRGNEKCFETRGLRGKDQITIFEDCTTDLKRDYTSFLNNWALR